VAAACCGGQQILLIHSYNHL